MGLTGAGVDPELDRALQGVDDGLLAILPGAIQVRGIQEQHCGSFGNEKVLLTLGPQSQSSELGPENLAVTSLRAVGATTLGPQSPDLCGDRMDTVP